MVKAATRAARVVNHKAAKAGKVAPRAVQPLATRARTKKAGIKVRAKVVKLATRAVKAVRAAKATEAARLIKAVIRTVARVEPKAAQANSMPKQAGKVTRMTNADF